MTDFSDKELETLIICSFRYALNRRTSVCEEICDLILKHKERLPSWAQDQFRRDIHYEIEVNKQIGEPIKSCWLKLKEELQE